MHKWQEGELGVARDTEGLFTPGTIVRCEDGDTGPWGVGFWSIVFGPTPTDSERFSHDIGLWLEFVDNVDPLPKGEQNARLEER